MLIYEKICMSSDNNRTVIVKFGSASTATGILRKSQTLHNTEKSKKLSVSPDRTILQRNKHLQLVTELKRRAGEDNGRRYFIRDSEIQSEPGGTSCFRGEKNEKGRLKD